MIRFENDMELRKDLEKELISTSEVTELLGCTRQYIHECVKKGILDPLKVGNKERIYLKSDIMAHINRKRK
ncbi:MULTISPECIES: helix-turn-helix transcriptional regulator [Bacillaceae]|uniref:helix-turn-helix transcriptional regulator n=1 Tax=Bacillaceae TaxID=186817 RepID=UPI0006601CD2|nr:MULTISPECIES: helix-turn-helix domain-containing protein [Bacillaceae]MCF2650192.1 helix-turn-helix domain-containing protein [Niallia circulans]CAI9396036.1 hypothetical protein BACSP_04266 [Bacillus sp. T2.9-1]